MANTHNNPAVAEYFPMFNDALAPYLFTGGAPAVPSASLTLAAFATSGYVTDTGILCYVAQAAAAVGPLSDGDGVYWLALHRNTSSPVTTWTRQAGTHYLWKLAATLPVTPPGTLIFAKVTVTSGVVSATVTIARMRGTTGRPAFNPADVGFASTASAAVNTTALQYMANAQAALVESWQPNLPLGVTTHTIPEVVIPDGRYQINDQVTFSNNAIIRGIGSPALEQTAPGKGILLFPDAYRVEVHGLKFIEGTRQISYLHHPTNDTAYLRVRNCEFQYARDTAIWQLGLLGVDSPSVSTTLAAEAAGGDGSIEVASVTGLDSEGDLVLVNDLGEYFHTRYSSNVGTTIVIRYPIPAHWTGSAVASAGNAVKRGVFTQNSMTSVDDCWFMYVAKCIESTGETTTVDRCWAYLSKLNFVANTPAFLSYGSRLNLRNLLGVPQMGTVYGGDRLNAVRWIDNYLYTSAVDCRFGGEDGGMVPVYNFGTYNPSSPHNGLCGIALKDCELAFGLTGGPEGNHAAIYCATGFPQRVHISGARAYQRSGEWIVLSSAINWTTYFSTAEAIAGVTFSILIDDNEGEYASIPTLPDALYRYMHQLLAPVAISTLGTEPVPSPLEDRAYLWSSDINGAGTAGLTISDEPGNIYRIGPGIAGAGIYVPRIASQASLATGSSGTDSLVDFADLTLDVLGPYAIWLVTMSGNPNAAGSASYRDAYLGVLILLTGDNPGLTSYLSLTDLAAPALTGVADLTVSAWFYDGASEVDGATGVAALSASYYLRIKVAGYAGAVGSSQVVTLTRLQ